VADAHFPDQLVGRLALWAALVLADEIVQTYQFAHTHLLILISQMATLLVLYLLP
jgi:hypothetical protein